MARRTGIRSWVCVLGALVAAVTALEAMSGSALSRPDGATRSMSPIEWLHDGDS
jgi:hypothetical protein